MAEPWESLPDLPPEDEWEALPDVQPAGPDWATTVEARPQYDRTISGPESALVGSAHGVSSAFLDEASGVADAVGGVLKRAGQFWGVVPDEEALTPQGESEALAFGSRRAPPTPSQEYMQGRDDMRRYVDRARAANPAEFMVGELGGAGLQAAAVPLGNGLRGAVATGAAQGLVGGAGLSEADDLAGIATDSATGGAIGAAGGAMGYGLGKAMEKVAEAATSTVPARWVKGKVQKAVADQRAAVQKKADEALRSGVSALGGETSSANRTLEVIQAILSDPMSPPAQKAQAQAFLESEAGRRLIDGARAATLERAPGQLARVDAARAALDPLRDAASDTVVERATAEALSRPAQPVVEFMKRYSSRAIPPIVAAWAGDQIGGPTGFLVGAEVGGIVGAQLGAPGTAFRNVVRNPAVRKVAWESLEAVVTKAPQALGKYGAVLSRALQKGPAEFAVTQFVLQESDPEFRQLQERLREEGSGLAEAP